MSTRSRRMYAAAVPLGLFISGVLVWQSSYAAFTATTDNGGNTFSAGTVALSDNSTGTALFTAPNLKPTDSGSACIRVDYTGSLAATVKMYVKPGDLTNTTGDLSPYLTFQVLEGSGNSTTCSDFSANPATPIYNTTGSTGTGTTLSTFAGSSTGFASGVSGFAPTGTGQSKTYRINYWLQDNNNAQGKNSTVKFTWEAQNS